MAHNVNLAYVNEKQPRGPLMEFALALIDELPIAKLLQVVGADAGRRRHDDEFPIGDETRRRRRDGQAE